MSGAPPQAFNFRSMAGLAVNGGIVATGLFRSDLLHRAGNETATRHLVALGINRVIDLRTESERSADGTLESTEHVEVHHAPLLEDVWSWQDERDAEDEWFLRDRTIDTLTHRAEAVLGVLDLLDHNGGVVFHCTAGKDRTGTVATALLGLLGATPAVIAADYAQSAAAMPAIVGWYRQQAGMGVLPAEELDLIIDRAARAATMIAVDAFIREHYGAYSAWARHHGGADIDIRLDQRWRT